MMAANYNSYVVQMVLGVAHYQIYNRRRYMNLETPQNSKLQQELCQQWMWIMTCQLSWHS